MKEEGVKTAIFKKGLKSIPKTIWVFCASYALIMVTNLFVLNFAHIDADKHINRYLDIVLSQKESKAKPNKELELRLQAIIKRLEEVERLAHETTLKKPNNRKAK